MPQAAVMRDLFDRVAGRYDLANRVLSAGIDVRWRRAVAQEVMRNHPQAILDICSGTADQAIAFREQGFKGTVICTDISGEMLRLGRKKCDKKNIGHAAVLSDVHHLALRGGIFDCATICFGVRNFDDIAGGLKEVGRVLRPGGRIVILEFTPPASVVTKSLYQAYLTKVLPWIGGLLTGQRTAYRYLASSIQGFLTPEELGVRLESAGFAHVRHRFLTSGVVALTTAHKK